MSIQKRLKKLNEIYAKIPEIECKNCGECCGPIEFLPIERINLNRFLKANGIKKQKLISTVKVLKMIINDSADGLVCPYRKDGKCSIYPVRPIVCRLFGVVKHEKGIANLECPHMEAWTYLTEEESYKLTKEVRLI